MKAINKLSTTCLLLAVLSSGAPSAVQAQSSGISLLEASAAVGQADGMSERERRSQAEQLLKLARQAMSEGKPQLAEKHLQRAEALNANFDSLFAKFVDTPEKVRRDLEQQIAQGDSQGRPSSRFSPFNGKEQTATPPGDPFSANKPSQLLSQIDNGSKARAASFLAKARASLQAKDLPGAIGWWQKANAEQAQFTPSEDNPAAVAQALVQAGVDPSRLVPARSASPRGLVPSNISKNELQRLPPVQTAGAPSTASDRNAAFQGSIGDFGSRASLTDGNDKARASQLVAQAKVALDRGDLKNAARLAKLATELRVPDNAFTAGETRPWELQLAIDKQARMQPGTVANAAHTDSDDKNFPVQQGLFIPARDSTQNQQAQALVPNPAGGDDPEIGLNRVNPPPNANPDNSVLGADPNAGNVGFELYQRGLRALEIQDRQAAIQHFRDAWKYESELDPATRQQLKDKLQLLSSTPAGATINEPSPLEAISNQQQLLRQKLYREISTEERAAEQMLISDPKGALQRMQRLRDRVSQSELDPVALKQLLTIVDRSVNDLQAYVDQNRGQIELDERNREILQGIERDRENKFEVQNKVAELVEQFNTLLEEDRLEEAEVIAKQVRELDPESPIARTLLLKSKLFSRYKRQQWIDEQSEDGVVKALESVDESGIPFNDRDPFVFGNIRRWNELSKTRREWLEMSRRRLSPVEMDIQEALKQKVEVRFSNRPLSEVLDTLGSMAGINIYADLEGIAAEGASTDTPININLTQPISLRSALNLILEPLRLSYVIQHEVLRVTSEQARDSNVYTEVYNVADLVIPIPNFVPGYNVGLPNAIREAHRALGYGGVVQPVSMSPFTLASNQADGDGTNIDSSVLAQTNAFGLGRNNTASRPAQPGGPGAMGGAALADFDMLIDLITTTIEPTTWDTVGGPGAVQEFPLNLSLVISQTQEVHDQIADLLEQLRRLQDLQVTIEVRFITLQDNFFERIGIDFDFDIDDNVVNLPADDAGPSVTIGLDPAGNPTADLDLSFTQGSFGIAQPAFGGFQGANAANFGFAILSDIEAFFVIQAAQGDSRSNVLQAPKVTLFNGQTASVNDTSQRPFVTSLIPVVGDFAAAHQPVIVVLSEGTSLSVQAVVSQDRRFVRLTLVPVFSQIGNVDTFTFTGRTTTDTGTNVIDDDGNVTGSTDNNVMTTEGTTVQLPTFSFTTVSTTVSVPDGGTVLLGGIKRLREGRNETGVPMLSKLPYVNRLFKNVGIGRETQSLMLMVTPRIIIQEEEEGKLGIE